jgi:hypothetical protein
MQLTLPRQSETVGRVTVWVGLMKRIGTTAVWVALVGIFALPAAGAWAQTAPAGTRVAQAAPAPDDPSATAPRARRPLRRLRIYPRYEAAPDDVYPRYDPGPNAVRDCTATYVQEYRPSGTVIVPRMHCFWRQG